MNISKNKVGFSLVEVLVVMFIAAVVFSSFYAVSTIGTRYIIESKNRLGAIALANEKMEIVRNLKYEDVGLQTGIPSGKLSEDEDVVTNGKRFHINTLVKYEDDSLDGIFPADVINNDYKTVKIIVSWRDSIGQDKQVTSISRFVPPGLETSAGGAPLAINVKGSDGVGVSQASVHIINTAVSPNLNFTIQTDNNGHIMIPGAPTSLNGYQITVSKSDYETVATANPATPITIPTYRHASVLVNVLNMYDYIQDKLSKLTVATLDYQNNPIGGIQFTIKGGKVLGRTATNVDVMNVDAADTTDITTGLKEYATISPGNYAIAMIANAKYEFIEYDPIASPLAIVPDTNVIYKLKLADINVNAILAKVTDNTTNAPILDATVSLKDSLGTDVFVGKSVSGNGIAYYPDASIPLPPGSYTLKVEAANYTTQEIPVVINKLTKQLVKLVKS